MPARNLIILLMAAITAVFVGGCAEWNRLIGEEPPAKNIKMASLFQDNMVLQRDTPLLIWGWCESGHKVELEIIGQKYHAVADSQGRWEIKLDPIPSCGPVTMIVRGKEELKIKNVMFGEVWLCAGQSNMAMKLKSCRNGDKEAALANYSQIRFFQVDNVSAVAPRTECKGNWQVCTPETAPNFSGVGYFFGRDLHRNINVAIGLIEVSWGGTSIEAWMPWSLQTADPEYKRHIDKWKRYVTGSERAPLDHAYQEALKRWEKMDKSQPGPQRHADSGNRGFALGWALPEGQDPTEWTDVKLPADIEEYFGDIDGAVWFRKKLTLPPEWAGKTLILELGTIDDYDETYFNGESVGEIGLANAGAREIAREYRVPGKMVKPGNNLLAIRVFDQNGKGGFTGRPDNMKIFPVNRAAEAIRIDGTWQARVEQQLDPFALGSHAKPVPPPGPGDRNWPSGIRSGMIAPLIPYVIRGVIWYQGESNASRADLYHRQLPEMVKEWRKAWGIDFSFLTVQLPNYGVQSPIPENHPWSVIREAQMSLPSQITNAATAVTIDLGEGNNLHPKDKEQVGFRLAMLALDKVYGRKFNKGKKIVSGGPEFESMSVKDGKAIIRFRNIGNGLKVKGDGSLRHFAIAGKDGYFHWANAQIEGKDTVAVWSGKVSDPVTVRYAWAANPEGCNLFNEEGFPASPFRATMTAAPPANSQ